MSSKGGRKDPLAMIADFQRQVLKSNLSQEEMNEEVRMMRFKIRPLQGDVLTLNLRDSDFIEVLWNLGKLDEFFHQHYYNLGRREQKIFFDIFDNLHTKFENQLNKLNILPAHEENPSVEMEIFKEYPTKKKLN